jgi:hypothetical protein
MCAIRVCRLLLHSNDPTYCRLYKLQYSYVCNIYSFVISFFARAISISLSTNWIERRESNNQESVNREN